MVAKIGVSNKLYGVLAYNFEKIKDKEAKVLGVSRLSITEDGTTTLQQALADFQMHLPQDIRTKKPIIHISLNPHPDDKLSDEQMEAISREYLEKLGYVNQPYVIFKHEDLAREHIHIVSLRVDAAGKKLNDAFEYRRSKEITNELEQKYHLIVANDRQRTTFDEVRKADINEGNIKKQLAGIVRPLVKNYQFQSLGEMNALLGLYNVTSEVVKGEHRGKPYTGLLYFIMGEYREKVSVPVKSSRIGRDVGFTELSKKFEKDKVALKAGKSNSKTAQYIQELMQENPNRSAFIEKLKCKGVDVIIRENEAGRIYGVTFINHAEKSVQNGSRFGKNFSANVFHEYFNGSGINPFDNQEKLSKENLQQQSFKQELTPSKPSDEETETLLEALLPDDLENLIELTAHGVDYKELAFQRKMRRLHSGKKRRRKR